MTRLVLLVVGGLCALVAVVALVGACLPREHRAAVRARFAADPERVYALIADVEGFPSWRADVRAVREIEPRGGRPAFVEEGRHGSVTYAVTADEPPRRRVLAIADEDLPYGGTWTFELASEGAGTTVTVTEDGFVRPVLMRPIARFVLGYHATMEAWLRDLGGALGEDVTVERVDV